MPCRPSVRRVLLPLLLGAAPAAAAAGQAPSLAAYFGYETLELVQIDPGAGPVAIADMDGDGLEDLVVVNNHASRIEVHYQRRDASPDDALRATRRVNELPEHWRYRRELVSVSHQVNAVVAHDVDGDGLRDLVYAGTPREIVFMRQTGPGTFEMVDRHRERRLTANRNGFAVADLVGDDAPELVALVDEEVHVWPLDGTSLGTPFTLAAGQTLDAMLIEDFDGDGRLDVVGIIAEHPAPLRLWLGARDAAGGTLGAQVRFEMPPLREAEAVRLPGEPAARLAVIERASKRMLLFEVTSERIDETGDRDAAIRVFSFTDGASRDRRTAVADVDGDGREDLVATDTEANALVVYRQLPDRGLQSGESYPCLTDLEYLAAGDVDDDPEAELFVLSEKEGVVGRVDVAPDGTLPFPAPLGISDGATPVALGLVELESGWHVAVIGKDSREHVLDLLAMDGSRETIELGSLSRSPETIIALDADQDGRTDLLLFTRDKPMTMLRATDDGFALTESDDMGQYGLVKAATADNTAIFDVDGDGRSELLLATENFVRAVRYDPDPGAGVSGGWQVIEQINARDPRAELVAVAVLGRRIVAADKESSRLLVMARGASEGWREIEAVTVTGFAFGAIHAGAFSGDGEDNILAIGSDGFGVVRLAGERCRLREFAAWRSDEERRVHHELVVGDLNGDGFTDLASLDAGEQMCELFSISEAHRLLHATAFKVFETKLFSGGDVREYEPSAGHVADVTGDGAADLVLVAHDRVLVYPQMTERSRR